ncbi:clorobiocin biosynthesis protein CloN5 [Actinomadura pelletieri DSM 43383]|uniref:Clorobiocin biosynthesis protein CloN5 n=1 Tax=Actinomadura pelletieri DSM 43383 TaxID=1120940 RepID=A0A495Q9N5_9ACTN|nr:acyl carrier protein [Actinomadura pelletieri]RKS68205.1 clorobiocin biosynthesis protein CloN5 [Actinomadura pelletieri DSM 43383]
MTQEEITGRLVAFIQENLLADEQDITIAADTPLLELGILNSLRTAILLNYIRDELRAHFPPEMITARNFGTPDGIAAIVHGTIALTPGS